MNAMKKLDNTEVHLKPETENLTGSGASTQVEQPQQDQQEQRVVGLDSVSNTQGERDVTGNDREHPHDHTHSTESANGPVLPAIRSLWQRTFPLGYKKYCLATVAISWRLVLAYMFTYTLGPVSLMFCGHLGMTELGGAALGISMINVFGVSIAAGMGTACDTLISQTYGSGNNKQVSVYVQQGFLIMTQAALLLVALHLNLEQILRLIGQDPDLSRLAGEYVLYFIPGLLFIFWNRIAAKYLENQKYLYPTVISGFAANLFHGGLQWLYVRYFDWGLRGSSAAYATGYGAILTMNLAYIVGSKMYLRTWDGWSKECLKDWGIFFTLSIHGILCVCVEWWTFEVVLILSGLVNEIQLGAVGIIFQLEMFCFMIPLGIMNSSTIQIGTYLGAGKAQDAKTVAKVNYTIICLIIIVEGLLVLSLRHYLPKLFSHDEPVLSLATDYILILIVILIFDCVGGVNHGVMRGTGNQQYGSIALAIGYCLVGLPVGVPLMFYTDLESAGLLWGMTSGMGIQVFLLIVLIIRIDWEKEVKKAQARAKIANDSSSNTNKLLKSKDQESDVAMDYTSDKPFQNKAKNNYSDMSQNGTENDELLELSPCKNKVTNTGEPERTLRNSPLWKRKLRCSTKLLVIQRFGTFLAVLLVVAAGIITRMTVKVY